LPYLCHSIDNTTDEANENGRDTSESNGSIEEDETTESKGKLVQSANHGISRRRGDTDAPGRGIGNEYGGKTREDHSGNQRATFVHREVLVDVC
jgi:hypothetical protein